MTDVEVPTADAFEDWIPAPTAAAYLRKQNHWSEYATVATVLQMIADDEIAAAARKIVWRSQGEEKAKPIWPIPKSWWPDSAAQHWNDTFWNTGHIQFNLSRETSHYSPKRSASCTDVRFRREDITRLVLPSINSVAMHTPSPQQTRPAPLTDHLGPHAAALLTAPLTTSEFQQGSAPPRGRPQKSFWDDAILAVAQTIHVGDFKPERQADVQRALAEWLSAHGYDAGDTAIKERARKLFNSFKY